MERIPNEKGTEYRLRRGCRSLVLLERYATATDPEEEEEEEERVLPALRAVGIGGVGRGKVQGWTWTIFFRKILMSDLGRT